MDTQQVEGSGMKKIALWVIIALVVIGGGWMLARKPAQTNAEVIKIGLSMPLTGEAASYGEGALGGIQLAVKEINDAGGVSGRKIEIVIEDDKCEPIAGVNVMNKLITVDKVDVIVGPLCSSVAGASLSIAQKAGIPTIFWGSAPALIKTGDYMFRTYPSDAYQGKFVAEYFYNTLKKTKVAIIYTKNDWGQGIKDVFVARFKELGGEVVFEDGLTQNAKDARTIIAKVKASNPDALYLPIYPANAVVVLKQLTEAGVKLPVFGGDSWGGKETWELKDAQGKFYAQARTGNPEDFKKKVKEVSGKEANFVSPYGYDSIKVMAEAIKIAKSTDGPAVRNALAGIKYAPAIATPVIEFDQNRDIKAVEFDLMVIKDKNGVKVE